MKVLLSIFTFFFIFQCFAQVGIGINPPKATAQLDVHSTTKGVLIPRMLDSERTAIVSPETSLLVFQTNDTPGYYYYDGSVWIRLTDDASVDDGDWVSHLVGSIKRQSGNVYIGDSNGTNNDLYISNSIIDWDDFNYLINPGSDSKMNEIEFDDGSSADPSIRFGDENTGFYSPATSEIALSINGTQRFKVNSDGTIRIDGNVGIFTDPDGPTANQSLKLYDADGYSNPNISISGHNSGLIYLESRRVDVTSGKKWTIGSGSGSVFDLDKFYIQNTDDLYCIVIRDGGNVGIGVLNPLSKLSVGGAGGVNTTTYSENSVVGGIAVHGVSTGDNSTGVYGSASGVGSQAGYFNGNVGIGGNLAVVGSVSKGSGTFKIDHPLDPTNKNLSHSFVESPDMMNVYNGNVFLDEMGEAIVILPNWFMPLNKDFRYQLTCIGAWAPLYIAEKISDNQFTIGGGKAGMEVSWQVTGIRQDAYANIHRAPIEEDKKKNERGKYLYPEAFGKPKEMGIHYRSGK